MRLEHRWQACAAATSRAPDQFSNSPLENSDPGFVVHLAGAHPPRCIVPRAVA